MDYKEVGEGGLRLPFVYVGVNVTKAIDTSETYL